MLNLCISHINQGFISLQTLRTHRQDGNKVKKERKLEYVEAFPYPSGRFFNTPTVPMRAKHTQFYMLCNVCLTINFTSPPKRGIVTNHTATTAEKKKKSSMIVPVGTNLILSFVFFLDIASLNSLLRVLLHMFRWGN